MSFTIGIDYGTNSVRALVVSCRDGRELGSAVSPYASGRDGILLDPREPHLARQHPGDYLVGLEQSVRGASNRAAEGGPDFSPDAVVGIGVDTTGSSPLPVDGSNRALGMSGAFRNHLAAQCWLWKDHTSCEEARTITHTTSHK